MPRVSFLLALLCLPFVVGCDGCRRDPGDPDDEKEKEAPLEDFSARPPQAFPADANPVSGGIKPGHWMTASQSLKSNKVDARGELLSRASASGASFQTGQEQTSEGELPTIRPVVLPKGQLRRFDYRILNPISSSSDQKRNFVSSRFVSTGRTVFFDTGRQPFNVLAGEEFFFVILTNRPERFAKFQVSDWVRPYRDENVVFRDSSANYRIVFPPTEDLLPLAETMLDWTSTAVVLWDDLSPDALTPQQQTAIADWVRFGGQLIVNGAPASDAISKTALAELLPLQPTGNIELDPDSATQLLTGWAVPSDRSTEKQIALLRSQSGRVAVDGLAAADAQTLPNCGSLVLSRRVGSGRIVQPRFDVTSDWLMNWQSYDSFVNSMLLARPRRELIESPDASDLSMIRQHYPDLNSSGSDPAMNTKFRITARDAVLLTSVSGDSSSATSSRIDPLTYADSSTGIGGWTDDSDTISLCRQILRSESGIEIPKSSLVIRSLGYYLLILVPINYLVFRLLGRLEYAWLAVPVIAIGGAIWVARAARLDIGFARSQTEVAFLELQPDYGRGHLSRVVAIYNSLSSTYDIQFKTIDAAASPIWGGSSSASGNGAVFRTGFAEGPMLAGLAVGSNQVRMLHAEQMIDVGGPIVLDGDGNLINQSSYELFDALVIEKSDAGEIRIATIGGCESGAAAKLRYRDVSAPSITEELPMQTARIVRRLASPAAMPSGSTRLVARIDASLPGMTITPDANQTSSQTIVLAHLKHAALPVPKVDVNLIGDLRRVLGDDQDGDSDEQDNS